MQELSCPICQELLLEPATLACCGGNFCLHCLQQHSEQTRNATCPLCRAALTKPKPNRAFQTLLERAYPKRSAARRKSLQDERLREQLRLQKSERYVDSWRASAVADELNALLRRRDRCWLLDNLQSAVEKNLGAPVTLQEVLYHLEVNCGAARAGWHRYGNVLYNAQWRDDLSVESREGAELLAAAAFLHECASAGNAEAVEFVQQQTSGVFAQLGRAQRNRSKWPLEFIETVPEHALQP
jgi:hypothetical protein